jgi:hypothetical protein
MTTLKLFVWLLFIAGDVWISFTIIERNRRRPRYLLLNIMRGIAFILWAKFVVGFEYDIFYLNYFVFATCSFWLLFDGALNAARGKHLLYIGATSGWLDRFGIKHQALYYIAKVIAVVGLTFATINIYTP